MTKNTSRVSLTKEQKETVKVPNKRAIEYYSLLHKMVPVKSIRPC